MKTVKLNTIREIPVIGIKILEKQYADNFVYDGIVHFSSPATWKDENSKTGHQLDKFEGCFCCSNTVIDEYFEKLGRHFERIDEDGLCRYYEINQRLMASCFYGVNISEFIPGKMIYGVKQIDTLERKVQKSFFTKFNEQDYLEKKAIIVFDMPLFIKSVRNKLIEMGCKEEDIIALPVYYVYKKDLYLSNEPFPFEYYLKDVAFQEQSEFRILINCKDNSFWERFASVNYNVVLGDISRYAKIQDYYQDDLYFSIQENSLVYSLAKPLQTSVDEMSFKEVVGLLHQTLQNQLPGEPLSNEDISVRVELISKVLLKRFGVKYCDDWRLECVPVSLFKELPELYQGMCRCIVDG